MRSFVPIQVERRASRQTARGGDALPDRHALRRGPLGARASGCIGLAVLLLAGTAASAGGGGSEDRGGGFDEPVWRAGRLVYPDGAAIPRHMTEVERAFVGLHPLRAPRSTGDAPTGPVYCPSEYDPTEAIIVSWRGWNTGVQQVQADIGRYVTTEGDADFWIGVVSSAQESQAYSRLDAAGADMSRVRFIQTPLDTIWIRDFGPRYIYEGEVRAIIDHTYNRPRPNDNNFPASYGDHRGHALYEIPLVHGGGNYHLDSLGTGYTTDLILDENPGLTRQQIHGYWAEYQNLDTAFFDPLPASIDSTQHIDMWMQIVDDDVVVISEWPDAPGSAQAQICDDAADWFIDRGWTVHRTPAVRVGTTHYSYTNVVLVNDLVLIPMYTNAAAAAYNSEALSVWEAAAGGRTVRQINAQAVVTAAGVLHCIVKHVPAHLGGDSPTAYLRTPRGSDTYEPGDRVEVRWITDDREGVETVDLELSLDAGATWRHIEQSMPDTGVYEWTVPDEPADDARLRITARNADGRTGSDTHEDGFRIAPAPCIADWNGDGEVDINDFFAYLNDFEAGDPRADLNQDGEIDINDFFMFLDEYAQGC